MDELDRACHEEEDDEEQVDGTDASRGSRVVVFLRLTPKASKDVHG